MDAAGWPRAAWSSSPAPRARASHRCCVRGCCRAGPWPAGTGIRRVAPDRHGAGQEPLAELAAQLAAHGGGTRRDREGLVRHPDEAHLAIWSAVLADGSRHGARDGAERLTAGDAAPRLVLIVDQFEQVFTLNSGPETAPGAAGVHHGARARPRPRRSARGRSRRRWWSSRSGGISWTAARLTPSSPPRCGGQFVVGPMTEFGAAAGHHRPGRRGRADRPAS